MNSKVSSAIAASLLLLLLSNLQFSEAYFGYRKEIPNGDNVPNPCEQGTIWEGVGHQNPAGAGVRNPFGKDFAANGFKWTEQLCRADSDGDGYTNGAELGDPECVWSKGATPSRTNGISHPGLCPFDSATCKNSWEVCPKKFECPALDEPGVYTRNFTLDETSVPPNETVYICQAFELNTTSTGVHMIGSRPIIRNKNVMHHAIIYGCTKKPAQNLFDSPQLCFMGNEDCQEIINLWTFGVDGECFYEQAGVLIGGQGYQYGLLELHWNNPEKVSNYKDSSGFSLYLTDDLRPNNQGTLIYGELLLAIPPRQPLVSYNHTCPSGCTAAYHNGSRFITSTLIHMHKYGIQGRISLMRNGSLVKDLTPMHDYDYNSPVMDSFNPPVEFLPGDEITTECYYTTKGYNESVHWGYDTQQEMCFSFINYYPNDLSVGPLEKLSSCYAHGGINQCLSMLPGNHIEADCNVTALKNGDAADAALQQLELNHCDKIGCMRKCRDFLTASFWPHNACFDPKRSKQMAEAVATNWWLASGANYQEKKLITQRIFLVLQLQSACENELNILEEKEEVCPTLPPATRPPVEPTTKAPATHAPPTTAAPKGDKNNDNDVIIRSNSHLFVITVVCCTLSLLLVLVAMVILACSRSTAASNESNYSYNNNNSSHSNQHSSSVNGGHNAVSGTVNEAYIAKESRY